LKKIKGDFYELVLGQVVDLKTSKDELKEVLEFYEAILKAQRQTKLAFKVDLSHFDTKSSQHRNSQGLPFLRPEDVQIDQDLFAALLENIGQIIQSKTKKAVSATLKKTYLDGQWETLLRGLMEEGPDLERTAGEKKIDLALFSFLVVQSFSPFLENYAERLKGQIDLSSWLRGYCPVCGGEPLMARLEKETGKKWLFCWLCHSEWLFRRLECPFCGNNSQESLRYFYLEDEKAYRVDVCDRCKRYTKTVDARKTESIRSLFVEDLATLPLDMVAEKEGFVSRGGISFLGREGA
jgi:FdhE protein